MRYLGIDYGKKNIGLAFSEGLTATPLKVVSVGSLDDAVNKILQEIKNHQIDQVIIGQPDSGEALSIVKKFTQALRKFDINILETDETLSSQSAFGNMINLNLGKKKRRINEDAYAASLILQNYLDEKN